MSKTYLKIKIKSLAAEAKFIRAEERKFGKRSRPFRHEQYRIAEALMASGTVDNEPMPENLAKLAPVDDIFWGLRSHRLNIVRTEARHSLIAYGYLRRVPYSAIEKPGSTTPDWNKVSDIARRFGKPNSTAETVQMWAET